MERCRTSRYNQTGLILLAVITSALLGLAGCTMPSAPADLVTAVTTLTADGATVDPSATAPSTTAPSATETPAADDPDAEETVAGDGTAQEPVASPSPSTPATDPTAERDVRPIPLADPASAPDQEFSAMAWYGDLLVLVPQFPERNGNHLFTLPRAEVLAYLRGESDEPPTPELLPFNDGGLSSRVTGFEGYEAIAFDGDTVYLTVETRPGTWMLGYVVAGRVGPDGIVLDPALRTPIATQAPLQNMTDESLVIDGARVLTIYEANGRAVNAEPVANVFTRALEKSEPIPLANIEYRVTDATALDDARRFWAINYFWPGDEKLLPASDPLAATHGQGTTHAQAQTVERLVEFQVSDADVTLTDTPPIQLSLLPAGVARNWEGIVRLQDGDIDGFLLVTDKFPVTQLAFVAR